MSISTREFAAFLDAQLPAYDKLIIEKINNGMRKSRFQPAIQDVRKLPNALRVFFGPKSRRLRKALGSEQFAAIKRIALTMMARRFHRRVWTLSRKQRKLVMAEQFAPSRLCWFDKIEVGTWEPFPSCAGTRDRFGT